MYQRLHPRQEFEKYAAALVEKLLANIAFGVQQALRRPDAEAIHDLRVAVLRLRHALRLFRSMLPPQAQRARHRLARLQDRLGAVRTCDIAQEILQSKHVAPALGPSHSRLVLDRVRMQRQQAWRTLRQSLRKIQRADALARWRRHLVSSH